MEAWRSLLALTAGEGKVSCEHEDPGLLQASHILSKVAKELSVVLQTGGAAQHKSSNVFPSISLSTK